MPPLALYVHLPWCLRKCPYCDFNSYRAGAAPPRREYLGALIADLGAEASRAPNRALESVFIGGGTPSLFEPGEIARLLDAVAARFPLARDAEITLEANPGTVERGAFSGYLDAGVNRLSIGAQSFDPRALSALGRLHGPEDTRRAVAEARAAGCENLNLDLMYALPEQDAEAALADVEAAVALAPEHLSYYQLTLEPGTRFHLRPPPLPAEHDIEAIERRCHRRLAEAGYGRYEVSAWARAGRRCRHNLNYWRFGDYLAVGAGAHGKLTDEAGRVWRYEKPRAPQAYIAQFSVPGAARPSPARCVDEDDLAFEYLLNALRLTDGFSEGEFEARTGLPAAGLRARLAPAATEGLLREADGGRWRPTPLGYRFLNDLQARFLPVAGAAG